MQSAQMGWGMQDEDPSINELQAYAAELGVDFFSTAFDVASADFPRQL